MPSSIKRPSSPKRRRTGLKPSDCLSVYEALHELDNTLPSREHYLRVWSGLARDAARLIALQVREYAVEELVGTGGRPTSLTSLRSAASDLIQLSEALSSRRTSCRETTYRVVDLRRRIECGIGSTEDKARFIVNADAMTSDLRAALDLTVSNLLDDPVLLQCFNALKELEFLQDPCFGGSLPPPGSFELVGRLDIGFAYHSLVGILPVVACLDAAVNRLVQEARRAAKNALRDTAGRPESRVARLESASLSSSESPAPSSIC